MSADLSVADLLLASGFVVLAAFASLLLRLGLERSLAWAALRAVVQLGAVGLILRWVFGWNSAIGVLAVVTAMIAAAAQAAVSRPARWLDGGYAMAFVTLLGVGLSTSLAVTAFVVGIRPWYTPQYLIPLAGMILGNTLTGLSLCIEELLRAMVEDRARIESDLAMGATSWEAAREPVREAVRRGMVPTLNAMTVVGIVSLPGMMTGQILAGADPLKAVRYQIVVMFMLTASTAGGAVVMALLMVRRLFTRRHQVRLDVVHRRR